MMSIARRFYTLTSYELPGATMMKWATRRKELGWYESWGCIALMAFFVANIIYDLYRMVTQ